MNSIRTACLIACLAAGTSPAFAAQVIDADTLNRIADEGYNRGQVVTLAAHLTDRIGSRLTNSPGIRQAEKWSQEMFNSWGLSNVHAEGFPFGRGWSVEASHTRMVSPRSLMLRSMPLTWTPGTKGTVTAPIVVAPITHVRDLAEWKGKLKGKIVLTSLPDTPKDQVTAPFKRLDEAEIGKLNTYRLPTFDPDDSHDYIKRVNNAKEMDKFFAAEGAVTRVLELIGGAGNVGRRGAGAHVASRRRHPAWRRPHLQGGRNGFPAEHRAGCARLPPPGPPGQGRRSDAGNQ